MSTLREKIGTNVKRYRDKKHWNQTELGKIAGCSQGNISEFENGKKTPGLDLLERIAAALEVAPWQLLSEGITPDELRRLPDEIQQLLKLSESADPHLVELAQELTRLVVQVLEGGKKKRRRRGRPKRRKRPKR